MIHKVRKICECGCVRDALGPQGSNCAHGSPEEKYPRTARMKGDLSLRFGDICFFISKDGMEVLSASRRELLKGNRDRSMINKIQKIMGVRNVLCPHCSNCAHGSPEEK